MAIDVAFEVLTDPDFLITLTLSRSDGPGGYVDGIFQASARIDSTFQASVQPAVAEDFVNQEDSERFGGSQTIYSLTELKGSKDLTKADIIKNYLGVNWKVVQVQPWGHHGYYKSIMVKIDGGI
jgi:hypothetical protein